MSSTSSASVEVITRGLPRSKSRGRAGLGADGDDGVVVLDELLALLGLDAQGARVLEVAASVHDLNAAHLGQLRHAARQPGQNGFLPGPQFVYVNSGGAEDDAAMLGLARGGDGVGRVQQRLGGDAALVQTDAAQTLLALDQDDFLAQVRRVKGRGITARPGAHHYDFSFNRFHVKME